VFFSAERCHMVATNGHALAIVHVVPEEGDVTGWITPEVLQAWRKAAAKNPYLKHGAKLQATEEELILTTPEGQQRFRRPTYRPGSFPHYDAVIPTDYSDQPAFTLDIRLLVKLAEAIGFVDTRTGKSAMVAVFPSKDNRGAHLVKTSKDGPLGIIMPVRAPDEEKDWLTTLAAVDTRFQAELEEAKQFAAKQAAVQAAPEDDEDDEDDEEEEEFVPVAYRSEDGSTFYQHKNGEMTDTEAYDEADLIYATLEQLIENEGEFTKVEPDVCVAGSPAVNGICGDADCVCARTAKPVEEPVMEPVAEAEPEAEPVYEEPVVAAEDESQEVAEVAQINRKPARKSRRARKEKAA
jgi:hypothetical protein